MCGIFGIISYSEKGFFNFQKDEVKKIAANLLDESEIRGRDASGICLLSENDISIFKDSVKGSDLIKFQPFEDIMSIVSSTDDRFKAMIGHTRAETKGSHFFNVNNHPIIANKTIGVHNGIICNDDMLFAKYKDKIAREGQVDSEIIFRLIDMYIAEGKSITEAVNETSSQLVGSYACAFINIDHPNYVTLFKGSNYPSICIHTYEGDSLIIFASSSHILTGAIKDCNAFGPVNFSRKTEVGDRQGVRINISNGKTYVFDVRESNIGNRGYAGIVINRGYEEMCATCTDTYCGNCAFCSN